MIMRTGLIVMVCILRITSGSYLYHKVVNSCDNRMTGSLLLRNISLAKYKEILSIGKHESESSKEASLENMKALIKKSISEDRELTAMEGLDIIHELYASNFEKVLIADEEGIYYYQWPGMTYYLIYEDSEEETDLYRLYEFVLDDMESGIGHTVTYGWYRVNRTTGEITEWLN